jgi:hypothetical protein
MTQAAVFRIAPGHWLYSRLLSKLRVGSAPQAWFRLHHASFPGMNPASSTDVGCISLHGFVEVADQHAAHIAGLLAFLAPRRMAKVIVSRFRRHSVCVQKQSFPLSLFVSQTPSSITNSLRFGRRVKWFSSCDDMATKDWVLPLRMCPRDGWPDIRPRRVSAYVLWAR